MQGCRGSLGYVNSAPLLPFMKTSLNLQSTEHLRSQSPLIIGEDPRKEVVEVGGVVVFWNRLSSVSII